MRSNVRKMWTALLAVLFAAAVGFGLWFAFAPDARPASVQAAEEPIVSIQVVEQQPELKSYEDPSGDLISARNPIIEGTVTLPDGTVGDLTEYSRDAEFRIYTQEIGGEPIGHFRPLASDTGATFTRYLQVGIKITGYTDLIYSNRVPLTITKPNSVSLSVSFNGGSGFDAGTSLGDVNTTTGNTLAEDRLVVSVVYDNNFSTARELSFSDEQEYGSYWVTYPNGKDQFEYSKDEQTLKIHYQEGGQLYSAEVTIYVDEAFITAPTPEDNSVELVYNGRPQGYSFLFYDDNTMQATLSGGTGAHEEDKYTVSVTDAGDYSIKFSAKSGYRFQTLSSSIPAEDIEKDGDKIIGVTYHFTIQKATIGSVAIDSDAAFEDLYTYDDDTITPPAKTAITMTPETTVTLPEGVEALTAEWAKAEELIYTYTGINGTAYGPSSTLPENAGEYSWTVKISGMKNFNDFTGSGTNGGAGSFVIQKKSLTVPSLEKDQLPYNGSAQSATAGDYDSSLMTFDGDLDEEERINVGEYHATFTLTKPDNYQWETPEEGSGISVDGAVATVTWQIVQAKNTINDFKLDEDSWAWSETAKPSPSATAKFGGDITYKYYSDEDLENEITTLPTMWDVGTYYVTATSSSDTSEHKNYTSVTTDAISFTVSRAPIAKPALSQSEFTYDGTEQKPTLTTESPYYRFTVEGKTNAGDYKAYVTLDGNHCWQGETGDAATAVLELSWKILPRPITVSWDTTEQLIYNGEEQHPDASISNSIAGDSIDLTIQGAINAGESTARAIGITGTDAQNYTIDGGSNLTQTFSISPYTIAFEINVNNAVYGSFRGAEDISLTWSTPTLNNEDANITYTFTGTLNSGASYNNEFEAGSYTVTASVGNPNYTVAAEVTKQFDIARAAIVKPTEDSDTFIYNGNEQTYLPDGLPENYEDLLTISGNKKTEANESGYTVTVAIKDENNYQWAGNSQEELTFTFVINKATVSVGNYIFEPKGYEGTNPNDRQIVYSGALATSQLIIQKSDLFTVGERKNAEGQISDAVTVGQYSVTLTLTDADNYKWSRGSDDEIDGAMIVVKYSITQSQFAITVSLDKNSWTYGDTAGTPSISGNTSGGAESFQYYASEADAEKRENALSGMPTDAGTYWVVGVVSATDDYAQSVSTPVSFTIEKVVIGIAWGDAEFTYNGKEQAPTVTATGAVNGESLSLTLEGQATAAGDHTATVTGITIDGETAENYALPSTGLTKDFKILQRKVDVELMPYTVTYNGEAFGAVEAVIDTHYTASAASGDTGLLKGDALGITLTPKSEAINAGSYAWGEIEWSNKNYIVTVTGTAEVFKIDPAEITVTIEDKSSTYGDDLATLTYEITEGKLQGKDTANTIFTLQAQKDDETPLEKGDDARDYKIVGLITGEGLTNSGNYTVEFVGETGGETGVYTITQRDLTITVTGSIKYGEDAPTNVADYTVNFSGALKGDVETLKGLLSITVDDYSAGEDKGSYDLIVSGNESAASNQTWKNYDISFGAEGSNTLTVTPREITVTIDDVTTTYGTKGALKVTVTGSDNKDPIFIDDLVSSVTDTTDPARYVNVFELVLKNAKDEVFSHTATLDNGTYSIVLDENSKNSNYDITVTKGTYTVGRYQLSISLSQNLHGDETSPVYDGAAWTYSAKATYTVAGQSGEIDFTDQIVYYERTLSSFAESEKKLNGAPVDAGSYWAVLPATAASGNFEPTSQVSTDFTIAQREVEVVWAEDDFTYNGTDQKGKITAGYYAYQSGEKSKTLTNLKFTAQPEFKNAGTEYTFTAELNSALEKQNYKLTGEGVNADGTVSKTYEMKKASITISVSSPTFTYGDFKGTNSPGEGTETGKLTYKIGGLFGSDTVQVKLSYFQDGVPVTTLPENVGTYTVSATIAEHQNYTLDTVTLGTLTIEKKALSVEVDGESIQYGEDAPDVYNVTLEGALETEEAAIKDLLMFDTSAYSAGDIVNDYTVKASFGADEKGILSNYQYTVTDDGAVATCTLEVTPRKITVKIADVTTTYGTAGTLTANVTREDGTTNNAILDRDLVKKGGQVVSGIAQFANVFTLSLDNATLDRLLNVGDYTIVGAVTDGDGARGDNYEITFEGSQNYGGKEKTAGLYTVNPREVTVNFEVVPHGDSADLVYDGTAWKFTATAEGVEGEDVTFQVTYAASTGSPITDAVNAGSYTVSVAKGEKNIVAEGAVSNYIIETDQSKEFTIEKRTLTLEWVQTNVIPDEDGSGENKTKGYDSALMELESYTTGTGMDEPTDDADGELKVTFTANGRTTYYVRVELKDPLNYAWPENSTNVSGENGKNIEIGFSVNATTNNITFRLSGSDDPVAEVFGTYGEDFTVYIATSEDDSPAGYNVVVYIDSIVKGGADTDSIYYRFARDEAGIITVDTANTLEYDLLVDDLTTAGAGTYWMQVFALTDESSEYGIGRAYVKVTIGKKTITRDDINAIEFTTSFTYNGKEQKPVAKNLPEYLKVSFLEGGATDVTEGKELTATFTIVGNNCEFDGSVDSWTRVVTIKITPFVIDAIYWDENPSFTYNGTDQSEGVFVYFVDVDGTRAKLTATTEGGFLNAGEYTFTAQEPNDNYEFAVSANTTNTITMAKASVNVVIRDQSGEYTGEEFELKTRYDIDGRWSNDTAQELKLYEDLVKNLQLVIENGPAVNAGTYTITLKDGYKDLQNYDVNLQTGTLTITPKQLTFIWPAVTGGVYQGENPGVALTGSEFTGFVDGEDYVNIADDIKIVYSGTSYSGVDCGGALPTEAGSYTVTVTLGEGNYTLNAGAQAYLVARADYSFTVDINGWTYNKRHSSPISTRVRRMAATNIQVPRRPRRREVIL